MLLNSENLLMDMSPILLSESSLLSVGSTTVSVPFVEFLLISVVPFTEFDLSSETMDGT